MNDEVKLQGKQLKLFCNVVCFDVVFRRPPSNVKLFKEIVHFDYCFSGYTWFFTTNFGHMLRVRSKQNDICVL